jgi:hypothetical protein
MIVEDQLDRGLGRIGGIEKFEEFDVVLSGRQDGATPAAAGAYSVFDGGCG